MDSFTRNEAIRSAALNSLASFIRTGAFSAEEIMPFCTTTTDIILSDATAKCKASAQAACIAMMQCYPGVGLEKVGAGYFSPRLSIISYMTSKVVSRGTILLFDGLMD